MERVAGKSPRFFCILGEVERNLMLSTIWRRSVCKKSNDVKLNNAKIMKHKLLFRRFFASLLLLVVSTLSWAYDFESGGIHYNFLKDGSGVRVVGGEASNVITIPSQVTFNS